MSVHDAAFRTSRPGNLPRKMLLATVSAAALLAAAPDAYARPLGGSAPTSAPAAAAVAAAQSMAQDAAQAGRNAQNSLKQAAQAILAMQAAQQAARDAGRAAVNVSPSGIPNGLRLGGLQQATGPNATWIGANNPTEALDGARTKVNITQTQKNAVLTWQTYNVSENTDLRYDQAGNRDWVALNRVLDPNLAPSKILGNINADGTVLVINQSGIVFGSGAQINVGSLIATTLDVGPSSVRRIVGALQQVVPTDIDWRNQNFLQNGLLGYDTSTATALLSDLSPFAQFSAFSVPNPGNFFQPTAIVPNTGTISVAQGASITTGSGGLVLLTAPHLANAGRIASLSGQVILAATDSALILTPSTGARSDAVPDFGAPPDTNIRGLVPYVQGGQSAFGYYVWNQPGGLIEADRGNITLASPTFNASFSGRSAAYNDGILSATTSVSRNGSITIDGADVRLGAGSRLSILADAGGETIPQDPTSLAGFKPSAIKIGANANRIEMQSGSVLFAPAANVQFGNSLPTNPINFPGGQNILIDSGAEINVAGLTDVQVPTSQVQIVIDPAKKNELRDSPLYRDGFLNGATIYLDPRRSGVRDDGVAWIGSPLIDATAYSQLVGISADRLMTKGGNVSFGPNPTTLAQGAFQYTPSIVVRDGAVINTSGGWATYQAGTIRSTKLVDPLGHVVDIGDADPDGVYVGVYNGGYTVNHARWGIVEVFTSSLRKNDRYVPEYTEGRDAGILSAASVALLFDGMLNSQAYPGRRQLDTSKTGTGKSTVGGDLRAVQGSNNELPAGGALIVGGLADTQISTAAPLVPDSVYADLPRGQIASDTGKYSAPLTTTAPFIPTERRSTLFLTDDVLSNSGLSQVSLLTPGKVSIDADTKISLNAGGIFNVLAGRRIEANGDITIPSGRISFETTFAFQTGSLAGQTAAKTSLGDFDIAINGDVSVAGRWVNDYTAPLDYIQSHAWLDGGSVSLTAASNILKTFDSAGRALSITNVPVTRQDGFNPLPVATVQDISGSILVNANAELDLSGGGRIDPKGKFDLTARGGNLSLTSETGYYQTATDTQPSGFQVVSTINRNGAVIQLASINPDRINARIVVDPASIKAHGFGGGGAFTLVTPEFALGDKPAATGTVLPFDFFSTAGFASYDITSYKTEITPGSFLPGTFPSGSALSGGYNAVLATQTITVGAGQTLALTQSTLPNLLNLDQQVALRALDSGGDVNTVVAASIPVDAWDQRPVNLRLGGALELHVAQGGRVTGTAGSSLSVGGLLNEGTIRIAGGTLTQERIVPRIYATGIQGAIDAIGIRALSDVFSVNADGTIDPNAASRYTTSTGAAISNQDLAGTFFSYDGVTRGRPIYQLGLLDQGQGIVLGSGSVTDLSGSVVLDPRAIGRDGSITTGNILGGGTLAALPTQVIGGTPTSPIRQGGAIVARPGAVIDLSGTSGAFDAATRGTSSLGLGYVSTPVWSDGGSLLAGAGGTFTGAVIRAGGGDANARGGTLQFLNPILAQRDPTTPAANVVSSDMIAKSGFDTFVATGNLTSIGDVAIKLDRAFLLQPKSFDGIDASNAAIFTPVISTGGAMLIEAPYIALQNSVDQLNPATAGTPGKGTVTFRGSQIDITGSALFDRSVSRAIFDASGDIRLTGVAPWQTTYQGLPNTTPTLRGMISVNGDLSLTAAQIYPTTGTSFSITSTATDGTIAIGRSSGATPATPYSAGGNLLIQAAHIVQGGVIRVPFGTLTLGGNGAYQPSSNLATFAPATQSVVLADGSITSVSADGLSIPYGTTTDTIEWYFTPTGNDTLTAPPRKVLGINGGNIALGAGATIDLTGGGDVYAYEFVPGTGGSRDLLNQFNSDQYSANVVGGVGYQYPDRRQVYAIVPGLSQAPAAAYDPIYSTNYANLGSAAGVGRRVYLDGGNGLAAGWYTLLPAQYALLPGGMRVVERTDSKTALPGVSVRQADGTLVVSGRYGDALSGASESRDRLFSVQSQDVVRSYSNIVLMSGNKLAIDKATSNGTAIPRTGLDAGRLVLNPLNALTIDALVTTAAAPGGRGAQVDITGAKIDIVSSLAGVAGDGTVHLTSDGLNKLNAESLLIGGVRTDKADGTTNLAVSANSIVVANDAAHPIVAPEIVLAVDDGISGSVASRLILNDGATLIATGVLSDDRNGAFIIDGRLVSTVTNGLTSYAAPAQSGIGALVRVATGPERLVQRLRTPTSSTNPGSPAGLDATLTVGNATLRGGAIGLDTSHNVTIASAAQLLGQNISLGAGAIAFTNGTASAGTVIITPELQAILSRGDHLTLRSQTSIGFDNGNYNFGATTFDAASLLSRESGAVNLSASQLQLSNAGGPMATASDGVGTLNISADELSMGSGIVATSGFGGVNITAAKGFFSAGVGGGLDIGAADLRIVTPYIGDRSVVGVSPTLSTAMTLKTAGAVTITNAGTTAIDIAAVSGIPGSSLVIEGNSVTIAGTRVRATGGSLTVKSAGIIALSNGAVLEAPGYSKTFGDAADPKTAAAPGGTLSLAALGGGIVLGDATLSVGGGTGNGGSLKLSAANGVVDFGTAVLNGKGGPDGQGGSFSLDTLGAIDLVALNDRVVTNGFTGGFNLRTRTGDIVLGAGQTLRSGAVNLTADGGFVTVGGVIDTSGVNGGDIALYGVNGVTLLATAKLDSHADGYAADDTRRAQAGDVTLGTDFLPGRGVIRSDGSVGGGTADSGTISIASGALIDASARRPGNRLVRILRSGVVNYAYVQGDQGGIVTLRAPVVANGNGGNTVNVQVDSAASIVGARAIDLEAFKRWDLAAVANSGLYSGITRDAITNAITLDVRTDLDTANSDGTLTSVGGVNFLGDAGAGTIVDFVQNLDVSSAYGNLGGLAGRANFNARPGVELKYDGGITLASNWNLGAGVVNVDAAKAAGLMQVDPVSGQTYVVSGSEASLLANYTSLTYRVGGRPTGAAPIVSLRAGGDLRVKGSVTDGFYQFRDQYDPTYQSALNASSSVFALEGSLYDGAAYWDVPTYNADPNPYSNYPSPFINNCNYICNFIDQPLPTRGSGGAAPKIPFNALGNSPAALGSGPGGVGDPLASAVVMPLLPDGKVVASSSFRLTAGAATASADPMRVAASATGSVIVDAPKPQSMSIPTGAGSVKIGFYVNGSLVGDLFDFGQAGFDTYLQNLFPGLPSDAAISLLYNYDSLPAPLRDFIDQKLAADPNAQARYDGRVDDYGAMEAVLSLPLFAEYLAGHPEGFGGGGGGGGGNVTVNLLPQTVIRTGTGSIRLAAAGNVDLTGGSAVTYLNSDGTAASAPNGAQLGSASVYTAGHPAASISEVLRDPVTGAAVTVSAPAPTTSIFSAPPAFNYGNPAPNQQSDVVGLVIADTLRLVDGGNVEVTAQGNVLGRRDLSLSIRRSVNNNQAYPWVGFTAGLNFNSLGSMSDDQPWRVNSVSTDATSASINPQLFGGGIGALGGGDIRIAAGGAVSDITAVSDTSLITATATPAGGAATKILVTLGGGDVAVRAGGDILAARIDAASGTALLAAGGRIGGLQVQTGTNSFQYRDPSGMFRSVVLPTLVASETQVRIDDATVDLAARGDIAIQGIRQLDGYYSDRSSFNLVANGSILISNTAPQSPSIFQNRIGSYAIYPGTFTLAALMGDANLRAFAAPPGYSAPNQNPALAPAEYNYDAPSAILMTPNPTGQLSILAGGNIAPTKIAMLDADPDYLPGLFTRGGNIIIQSPNNNYDTARFQYQFAFPRVFSNTSEGKLETQHNQNTTHAGDATPAYVYAGGDIGTAISGVTLSLPKQARVFAGRDIINMLFFGQNVADSDLTRIVAGRDIIATTTLLPSTSLVNGPFGLTFTTGPTQPVLLGNSFTLGGPGDLMVEAGRNMGPFLNSAVIKNISSDDTGLGYFLNIPLRFSEGIVTVGNNYNPYLPEGGANITALFGVAKGANYDALRDAYVTPGTSANALGGYATKLIAWMQANAADVLNTKFGTRDVTEQQAYDAFVSLPVLRQRLFLINDVYFNELRAPAVKDGPSYLAYSRGYAAVNTLFPASLGYTANSLQGGANDGAIVHTGDLDLRLSAIETLNGGDISILGPGGRVLAGSVVSTAQQAARRNYAGYGLHSPQTNIGVSASLRIAPIDSIPPGFEGVITQRGGAINTFTDGDFLLNQSRLFSVKGGDITMWSSNADLNAGQGAKTTPNFPAVEVRIGKNLFAETDQANATSGAGIAALPAGVDAEPPDVYLLAPRGAVDAGDAGVRSAGDLSVAALRVVNADNFKVSGSTTGVPTVQAPNVTGLTEASNTAGAAAKQATTPTQESGNAQPSIIIVEVLGFGGGDGEDSRRGDDDKRRSSLGGQIYDPGSSFQVIGNGALTGEQQRKLTDDERKKMSGVQ